MNSPFRPLADEIRRIGAGDFHFVDLTLEPPGAWPVVPEDVRALLDETGLGVVGHTAWYLPIASPFPQLRAAARAVLVSAFDVFAAVGATHVNVHPDPVMRSYPRADAIAGNVDAVAELAPAAAARGLTLMVENMGRSFGTVAELAPLLDADPSVRFHLDVGHAHLAGQTNELLAAFGERLAHVHVSDNFGLDDLHLPLGAGSVVWREAVDAIRRTGYNGTVTLEVHSAELRHLEVSQQLWREWWQAA